jgi:hypothetical protein
MLGQADFTKLKGWAKNENIGVILAPQATFKSVRKTTAAELLA